MMGLLNGIRVLDFSWAWAGPHCTALLADAGADVIRIESTTRIDIQRETRPFFQHANSPENGAWQAMHNRGKRSCRLNLRHPVGRDVAVRLAARCDVLVENFRPGVMDRLGLGFSDVAAAAPGITYVSLYGYGSTSPLASCMAYGAQLAWASGLNFAGSPRAVSNIPYSDPLGGSFAAVAVALGLLRREDGSPAQHFEISQLDALLFALDGQDETGDSAAEVSAQANRPVLYQLAGDDQWVFIDEASPGFSDFVSWCQRLLRDHQGGGEAPLEEALKCWSPEVVSKLLAAFKIAHQFVLDASEVIANDKVTADPFFLVASNEAIGPYLVHGYPFRSAGTSTVQRGTVLPGAPALGEHTREILSSELDLSDAEILSLEESGALS